MNDAPARAYFLASGSDPENLARAEAALHELIASIDAGTASGVSCPRVTRTRRAIHLITHILSTFLQGSPEEYQQLRWMRLAVLKRRGAGDAALLECECHLAG